MKKVELLAPCGSFDALIAAVSAGADAVYLGGARFGARAFSQNFDRKELKEAIEYAHIYGVKVYVTVNTIIYENELDELIDYLSFLYDVQTDAVIVQDLGILEIIEKYFPDFEVHASTQMHIHNLNGVRFLKQQGIKRIVVSRETPISLIKELCKEDIEIETFVYGALCVSYSGQCLMSYMNGGRSGNRGECAQPCRFKYSLINDDSNRVEVSSQYLLSMKDLNTLENLSEIIEAGVSSLKIEGRMKRPEYVYEVVSTFRRAIDSYYAGKQSIENNQSLLTLFNRGFTKGHIFNEDNKHVTNFHRPNHIGIPLGQVESITKEGIVVKLVHDIHQNDGVRFILDKDDVGLTVNKLVQNGLLVNKARKGEEVTIQTSLKIPCKIGSKVVLTTDSLQINQINSAIQNSSKRIPITASFTAELDKVLTLTISDGKSVITVCSEELAQSAIKRSVTEENVKEILNKIKDSAYTYSDINISLQDNLFFSLKSINEMKREAISKLNNERVKIIREPNKYNYQTINSDLIVPEYIFDIVDRNQKDILKDKGLLFSTSNKLIDNRDCFRKTYRVNEGSNKIDTKYVLATQIADLYELDPDNVVIAGSSFNVSNSYALEFLLKRGVNSVIASIECTTNQITDLISGYIHRNHLKPSIGQFVYGKVEVMISKYCLINKCLNETKTGCNLCKLSNYSIIDQNNQKYLLTKDDFCHSIILTSKPFINNQVSEYTSFKYVKLFNETDKQVKEILK